MIAKPEGFEIPQSASDIHGITTAMAIERGIALQGVLGIFVRLAMVANSFHAYNAEFDKIVMQGEMARFKAFDGALDWNLIQCEMKPMTDICRLPGRFGFKWPSLTESHIHCYGKEFEAAHSALADCAAMIAIHRWRMNNQVDEKRICGACECHIGEDGYCGCDNYRHPAKGQLI